MDQQRIPKNGDSKKSEPAAEGEPLKKKRNLIRGALGAPTEDPKEIPPQGMSEDDKSSLLFEIHSYIREYISSADTKAAFIFTISGTIFGYLFSQGIVNCWLKSPKSWNGCDVFSMISTLLLLGSLACSIAVVWPRLKGSSKGFVYFGSIKEFESSSEFADKFLGLRNFEVNKEILKHTYELAKVCSGKYWWINKCLYLLSGSIASTVILFLIK